MPITAGMVSAASGLKNPAGALQLGYRVNQVVNPSIESSSTTEWSFRGTGGTTSVRSSEDAYAGSFSWKTTCGTVGEEAGPLYGKDNYRIPVIGSTQYTISCWAKLDPAATTQNFRFRLFNYTAQVAGSINAVAGVSTSLTVADGWKRFSATYTTPANALFCAFSFTTVSAITGEIFYADNFMFEKSATLKDYFDGNSPGAFWGGAENASISGITPY